MNFEVRGGKTYKGVGCQDLGSNWERIESDSIDVQTLIPELKSSNWERIERHALYVASSDDDVVVQQLGKN